MAKSKSNYSKPFLLLVSIVTVLFFIIRPFEFTGIQRTVVVIIWAIVSTLIFGWAAKLIIAADRVLRD